MTPPQPSNAKWGTLVFLNGPSAVGKSSIQKALQRLSSTFYLTVGIDTFFDALIAEPDLMSFEKTKTIEQYTPDGELIRRIESYRDEAGHPLVPLEIGPAGDRIIQGMHRALAAYARCGNSLIVDYILYKKSWAQDLALACQEIPIYLIGVTAPLEVIEKREQARATSPQGHARSHYHYVHSTFSYDLEVNTAVSSPEECALGIHTFITHHAPQAFQDRG